MGDLSLASILVWFVVFIFSTTVHEFGHAALGYLGGDRTAYESGQVSLDPMPHIRREPFGMVILPLLSMVFMGWMLGFASAPYDPRWSEKHPKKYALMSAAGPLGNFVLALIAFVIIWALVKAGLLELSGAMDIERIVVAPGDDTRSPMAMVAMALSIFLGLNIILGLFNLIPIPPLDGAGVLEGLWPESVGGFFQRMRGASGMGFFGLIIAMNLFPYVGGPVLRLVIVSLYRLAS